MASYNPPSIPMKPKSGAITANTSYQLRLAYFRYSVTFGLYVMSPAEKFILNSIILLVFGLMLYYLFPLAISTLAYAMVHWVRLPRADSMKIQHFIRDVNAGADASFAEGGASAIETSSYYDF